MIAIPIKIQLLNIQHLNDVCMSIPLDAHVITKVHFITGSS
jgi:hypothetical protein